MLAWGERRVRRLEISYNPLIATIVRRNGTVRKPKMKLDEVDLLEAAE
jgi:hypothetical protein